MSYTNIGDKTNGSASTNGGSGGRFERTFVETVSQSSPVHFINRISWYQGRGSPIGVPEGFGGHFGSGV